MPMTFAELLRDVERYIDEHYEPPTEAEELDMIIMEELGDTVPKFDADAEDIII